jgi:class 3 adenylate cyclase
VETPSLCRQKAEAVVDRGYRLYIFSKRNIFSKRSVGSASSARRRKHPAINLLGFTSSTDLTSPKVDSYICSNWNLGVIMDLDGWLRSLGLERYEGAFRENDIDETVLTNLTAEDLKELGVTAIGHRRKLLDAIAALRADVSASPTAAPGPAAVDNSPWDAAERRQVTVMFSDLVGSTPLSASMDAEDLREIISAYQKCVAETVSRFGGFVAKYMGDGVLIYFGYPQAHEDDAERAVRAGLELVTAVSGLKTQAPLQSRVGIATGLVVVGDLIGSGSSQEQAIVGDTPNIAARLQSIAEPNSVVIAESTRRLLGNLFELQDVRARDLKGITEPVQAWAALRASSAKGRSRHSAQPD